MSERLPELGIVERRQAGVESDVKDTEVGGRYDQVLVERFGRVEHPVQVEQADPGYVDLVVFIHCHRLAACQVHYDGVQVRRFEVEVLIALQHDPLADAILGQFKRPRPVWSVRPVAASRFHVLPIQDVCRRVRHLGQEVGFGSVDLDLQGVVIDDTYSGDVGRFTFEHIIDSDYVPKVSVRHRGRGIRVRRPFEGPLEVARGYWTTVLEPGIVADVEGIDLSVLADVPAIGYVRHQLEIGVQRYESAEDFDNDARRGSV